jgi:hypothetical protein
MRCCLLFTALDSTLTLQKVDANGLLLKLTCADAQLRLEGMTGNTWDTQTASGQGALTYPNCPPPTAIADCPTRASEPATVTLSVPRFCTNKKRNLFTSLHEVAPTADPALADFTQPFPCKLYGNRSP